MPPKLTAQFRCVPIAVSVSTAAAAQENPMPHRSDLRTSTSLKKAVLVLAEFQDYLRAQADAAAQREREGQAPRSNGLSPVGLSETWLDTPEAARHLKISVSTLTKWRMKTNRGPPFAKAGASVRYSLRDLDAWLSARRVTSTSAMAAACAGAAPSHDARVSAPRRRAATQP
jgi:hypothetical protein